MTAVLAVLGFVALSLPVTAQSGHTGAVAGTLVDAQGREVAGADVALENSVTHRMERLALTNAEGRFRFGQIAPGEYVLASRPSGSEAWTRDGVHVAPGETTVFRASLGGAVEPGEPASSPQMAVPASASAKAPLPAQTASRILPLPLASDAMPRPAGGASLSSANGARAALSVSPAEPMAKATMPGDSPAVVPAAGGGSLSRLLAAAHAGPPLPVAEARPALELASLEQIAQARDWVSFALNPDATLATDPETDAADEMLALRGMGAPAETGTVDQASGTQPLFRTSSRDRGLTGEPRKPREEMPSVAQSAVREVQFMPGTFSAEYATSSLLNTETRSGSARLHGRFFFSGRNHQWGATNPFTTLTQRTERGEFVTTPVRPNDQRQQWGFNLGGPLLHDKVFWFFAYDVHRRDFPGVARAENATRLFAHPSAENIDLLATRLGVTSAVAETSYASALSGIDSLLGVVPRRGTQTILFPKLDWQIGERHQLSMEFNRMRWNSVGGTRMGASDTTGRSSFGKSKAQSDWASLHWTAFLSPDLLNDLRLEYGRFLESEWSGSPSLFEQPMARNVWNQPPQTSLMRGAGGLTLGKPAYLDRRAAPDERRAEAADTLSWARGRHVLKLGYRLSRVEDRSDGIYNGTGSYTYASMLNFISDLVSPNHCDAAGSGYGMLPCYSHFSQAAGPSIFRFQTIDHAAFLADEWKLRPGFTLSLGARYEYQQLPDPNPSIVNPELADTARLPHDRNNVGARAGLAWDIFGSGRTVLRAGFGTYFGRINNALALTALSNTGAATAQRSYYFRPVDAGAPPFPFSFGSNPNVPVRPNAAYFDKGFQLPRTHQAEVEIEHEIRPATRLSAAYRASFGETLPNLADVNIDTAAAQTIHYTVRDVAAVGPLQGTYSVPFFTRRENPAYQQITDIFSETSSSYHAGVVRLAHRSSRLLDLHASYTFAHAIDYNQDESSFGGNNLLDPKNLKVERGNADSDIRHRVTGSAMLHAPWRLHGVSGLLANGYSLAPIGSYQSGMPYSMRTGGAVPSIQCTYQQFLSGECASTVVSGIGPGINGSGGDTRLPTVGRNTFRYPGRFLFDLRLAKRTRIHDRFDLRLTAEAFNLLNHQNVTAVESLGYSISGATSPTTLPRLTYLSGANGRRSFGDVINSNSTAFNRERQIQLGLWLDF